MPRIPVRIEPYSSPVRQHRHFKTKRDQILKALGKAAYINGSQYMILWVSARGEVETYASSVLQSKMNQWFSYEVIDEARRVVTENPIRQHRRPPTEADMQYDLEADSPNSLELDDEDNLDDMMPPKNQAAVSPLVLRDRNRVDAPVSQRKTSKKSNASDRAPVPNTSTITLATREAVDEFLEAKFGQIQQNCCKTVAKAWIKVIEPKKQNKFPYNKGESAKPEWWPSDVRHKEPDHLMKHERLKLLMTILRSPKLQRGQLELSTAEVSAFIPADKAVILKDIYNVAKEEERREKIEGDPVYPMTVSICATIPKSGAEGGDDASTASSTSTPQTRLSNSSQRAVLPSMPAPAFNPHEFNGSDIFQGKSIGGHNIPTASSASTPFHGDHHILRSSAGSSHLDHFTNSPTTYSHFFHDHITHAKPDYEESSHTLLEAQQDENGFSNVMMSGAFQGFNFGTIYEDLPPASQAHAMSQQHTPTHAHSSQAFAAFGLSPSLATFFPNSSPLRPYQHHGTHGTPTTQPLPPIGLPHPPSTLNSETKTTPVNNSTSQQLGYEYLDTMDNHINQ